MTTSPDCYFLKFVGGYFCFYLDFSLPKWSILEGMPSQKWGDSVLTRVSSQWGDPRVRPSSSDVQGQAFKDSVIIRKTPSAERFFSNFPVSRNNPPEINCSLWAWKSRENVIRYLFKIWLLIYHYNFLKNNIQEPLLEKKNHLILNNISFVTVHSYVTHTNYRELLI